jgi:hypothetical protein
MAIGFGRTLCSMRAFLKMDDIGARQDAAESHFSGEAKSSRDTSQ